MDFIIALLLLIFFLLTLCSPSFSLHITLTFFYTEFPCHYIGFACDHLTLSKRQQQTCFLLPNMKDKSQVCLTNMPPWSQNPLLFCNVSQNCNSLINLAVLSSDSSVLVTSNGWRKCGRLDFVIRMVLACSF